MLFRSGEFLLGGLVMYSFADLAESLIASKVQITKFVAVHGNFNTSITPVFIYDPMVDFFGGGN